MGAQREMYAVIGRFMEGKEVTSYRISSLASGKEKTVTREQFIYLLGRDQIKDCTGQLYGDKVLIRAEIHTPNGVIGINDLPIVSSKGITNAGVVKRGATAEQVMGSLTITAIIRRGKETVGYRVANRGGQTKDIDKSKAIDLARDKMIINARANKVGNEYLLRGNGDFRLDSLPVIKL